MKLFISVIIIFSNFVNILSLNDNSFAIEINRRIENSGFHRFLTSQISFNSNEKQLCKWLIVENFDQHVYVDVYELRQQMYENMYSFYLSNRVNIETIEYRSTKFQLFLILNNERLTCNERSELDVANGEKYKYRCSLTIRVPIHVRYHAPFESSSNETKSTNEFYKFSLNTSRIFATSCSLETDQTENNFKLPCEKNKTASRNDYLFFLDDAKSADSFSLKDNLKLCIWKEVKYSQIIEENSLSITIPRGNRDHEIVVLTVTLTILTFLALWVANSVRLTLKSIESSRDKNKVN